MTINKRIGAAIAAFIVAASVITFAVSMVVLCVIKVSPGLNAAYTIAAGVFLLQSLPALFIYTAIEDLGGCSDCFEENNQ
jgi:hypothetical protein